MEKIIYLPWPPTINSYYCRTRAHTSGNALYISSTGRRFREQVAESINEQLSGINVSDRIFLEVVLYPPDSRTRDLDNYLKALLDACTHAGLWEDDQLIDQLFVYRGITVKSGSVRMSISEAGPLIPHKAELQM